MLAALPPWYLLKPVLSSAPPVLWCDRHGGFFLPDSPRGVWHTVLSPFHLFILSFTCPPPPNDLAVSVCHPPRKERPDFLKPQDVWVPWHWSSFPGGPPFPQAPSLASLLQVLSL